MCSRSSCPKYTREVVDDDPARIQSACSVRYIRSHGMNHVFSSAKQRLGGAAREKTVRGRADPELPAPQGLCGVAYAWSSIPQAHALSLASLCMDSLNIACHMHTSNLTRGLEN